MTDAELLAEIEGTPPATSATTAVGRGLARGGTAYFSDEIGGALGATKSLKVPQDIRTPGPRALAKLYPGVPYPEASSRWFNENRPDIASVDAANQARQAQQEAYRAERATIRSADAKAKSDRPGLSLAGEVVGSIPLMLATGGGAVPVALTGALQGAGASDSDTGTGLLSDSALSAAGGLAAFGVGNAAGKGIQALDRLAGRRLSAAAAKAAELAQKKVDKAVAALRGAYGGARQNESRAIEVLLRAEATGALSPAQAQQLAALKASPEWTATVQNVAQNYMDDLPGMMGTATTAKGAYQTASQNAAQDAAAEQARLLSTDEMKQQVGARLKRYGPMGVAGAMAGGVVGGPFGALLGGASGAAVRPMLHAVRRAAEHPSVQTAMWTPLQSLARGAQAPALRVPLQMTARGAGAAAALGLSPSVATALDPEAAAQAEIDRLLSGE